jgi:S-(hydroxymethyl)glutathione dehydrogenase/alcohol dehydrogenase
MRAAVCREFGGRLQIEDVTIAAPREKEVRVGVAACAICHSDISFMDGDWGGDLPAVFGHEAAGIVTELGPDVESLHVGEHVVVTLVRACGGCYFCLRGEGVFCSADFPAGPERILDAGGLPVAQGLRTGAFAEEVVVHASQVQPLPEEMPLATASLLGCAVLTGVGAVRRVARVEPASTVVVIGAGGVGLSIVQGARLARAERIIVVDTVEEKLEAATAFGASDVVRSASGEPGEVVADLTEGRGADYVFVSVGVPAVMERAVALCRRGGTLVLAGLPADGATVTYDGVRLPNDGLRILGCKMGATRLDEDVPELVRLYGDGELMLDELVSGRFPLERINDAIAEVRTGKALRNVIVP